MTTDMDHGTPDRPARSTPRRYSDQVARPGPLQCSQACRSRPDGPGAGTPTLGRARSPGSGQSGARNGMINDG